MDAVVSAKTLVEQTFEILLDAICTGELAPGERLAQDLIAEKLNVSRQPVNSAIAILKSHRFVEDTGRRGVVVAPVDETLIQSICQLRMVVEPLAVELAIPNLNDARREAGRKALDFGVAMLEAGNARGMLQADMGFHRMIYEWSGNMVLADSMWANWHHMRRIMGEVLQNPGLTEEVWDEHRQILDAMFDARTEDAKTLMREHILLARDRVARRYRRAQGLE